MNIPFNDLKRFHDEIRNELISAFSQKLDTSSFINRVSVQEFEKRFSVLQDSKFCVACANGTDSLFVALKTLGVKPGDEIIVPTMSWIATSEVVSLCGAKVIFCDVEADTLTIDPTYIEQHISNDTVGIMPVHLYGCPADMEKITALAKRHNLWIIEDCAQAHLAEIRRKKVGTFGDFGSFSFFPGKNLGALGDAGALISNDSAKATTAKMYTMHGGLKKNEHFIEGMNSRLDEIQAAFLNIKLKFLEKKTQRRREIAQYFLENIDNQNLILPKVPKYISHSWHLFVIRTDFRSKFITHLSNNGIAHNINYPVSLPFLQPYNYLNSSEKHFPVAALEQHRVISIPLFPELCHEEIIKIIEVCNDFKI